MNETPRPQWDKEMKMRALGAFIGAVILVMVDGRPGLFAAFAFVGGAGLGALTVMMRTMADGWLGWAASIAFWWMPLVIYLAYRAI